MGGPIMRLGMFLSGYRMICSYNTAAACVTYCGENETPYEKFIRCMTNCECLQTQDGVAYNSPKVNQVEVNEMMKDL